MTTIDEPTPTAAAEAAQWENGDGPAEAYADYDVATMWLGLVQRLTTQIDQLQKELSADCRSLDTMIEEGVDAGLGLKSLTTDNGKVNLSLTTSGIAEETVLVMLDGLADMLGDATNYVEFDLRRRGKEPVSVCVRHSARPTPHDLRVAAERDRDAIADLLLQLVTAVREAIPVSGQTAIDGTLLQRADALLHRPQGDTDRPSRAFN